jgi:hypothetical protein
MKRISQDAIGRKTSVDKEHYLVQYRDPLRRDTSSFWEVADCTALTILLDVLIAE